MMSQLIHRLCNSAIIIKINSNNKKYVVLWAITCLLYSNFTFALFGPSIYVGPMPNVAIKHGYVMARSVVLDPATQQPILVNYNEDGTEAGVVSVGGGYNVNQLSIISAAAFHAEQQRIDAFNLQYKDTLAKGARLMSRSAFLSNSFKAADNITAIAKPNLASNINSVLVRGQSDRLLPDPEQLVLLKLSFEHTTANVADDSVSLVVSPEGNILAQSNKHIGYRTGFFGNPNEVQTGQSTGSVDNDEIIFGPVSGVKVNVDEFAYRGGVDVTNREGKYSFQFFMPTCPVGGFTFTTDVWSELHYSNLLPMGSPVHSYFLRTPGYDYCYADLVPVLIAPSVISILATQSIPLYQSNLYADVMFLTGVMYISNQQGFDVPIGETTHTAFSEPAKDRLQHFYDFNGDGQADNVVQGHLVTKTNEEGDDEEVFEANAEGNLQGLYFDTPEAEQEPDLVRIIDQEVRNTPVGLLKSISPADMRNTDVLFFRESTGQLIMERNGLKEAEVRSGDVQLDQEKQLVGYRVMLRGPRDWSLNIGGGTDRRSSYKEWATEHQLTEPFQEKNSDYLREGETIKVVAINRATGYMGTVRAKLERSSSGDLTVLAPPLVLSPPNLKIWAERKYNVESGLTKGEERNYTIGAEGAALTSDTTITIYTEWLDESGNPLPEELGLDNGEQYGFTGRLAKVVNPGQLQGVGAGNDLASFAIAPGRKTQVINVGSNLTSAEHYYVHVIGKGKDQECSGGGSCPSFTDLGSNAPYDTRPNLLVPFLVPLPDEDSTWQAYNAYRGLLANDEITDKPNKPLPAYTWAYRPEYQFSQYGLEMQEIKATNANGTIESGNNILTSDSPTIASSDDYITALYSLISSNNDRLTAIDGPQELVLALGEEEQLITIGDNNSITFSNVEHLASLDPEDFLSMRLYTNNDASNILWEYAFEFLNIESATIGYNNQTEDIWYVTADDPVVEMKASLLGYAYRGSDKDPVSVSWQANGSGSFSPAIQTSVDLGVFDSTLTMAPAKGATAQISVKLADGDTTAHWKTVEVLAGEAYSLIVTSSGQAVAWQQGDVRINVLVYDKHGNLVEDGTEVSFDLLDSLIIKEQQLNTENGEAYIVLTGGEYAKDSTEVTIKTGDITRTQTLSIQGLEVELTASSTVLNRQEPTTLTAVVTTPSGKKVPNVPVSFSAKRGSFGNDNVLTDASGTVTTQFMAGLNPVDDQWIAQVGYVGVGQLDYRVRHNGASINAAETMLVADELNDGDITYDHYGIPATIGYETSATLDINLDLGGNLTLGDIADPNLEPLYALTMNSFDSASNFKDEHGLTEVPTENISFVRDHPLGSGLSAEFLDSNNALDPNFKGSQVVIPSTASLNLLDNIGTRIDLKPKANGTVFEHGNGGQKLSYENNTLTYQVTTSSGIYTVTADSVTENNWHSVATRIANNKIELYVDGNITEQAITGTIEYGSDTSITIGGLHAVMRGFKIYDWTSQPLVSFEDGSNTKSLNAGIHTLTLKSLGNLDKHHTNSTLKSVRVALVSGTERNYASLLTKNGYQNLATQYLSTASPESPLAYYYAPNPLNGLVPTAMAWSWNGVWDGVKGTVGFLIPFEDFIIIGEQLMYLVQQDWKNFDPVALAFASLGAATIIPIAKPLKPLLGPLKKVLDGMKRFPAIKHFAGAIGTGVKEGISGKFDKITALLPFILISIELYEEPEIFEFMMNAIETEDDLWTWVDYISEVVKVEGGLDTLASYNGDLYNSTNMQLAVNPLSFVVNNAYAKSTKNITDKLIPRIKALTKSFDLKDAKQVTGALRSIAKDPQLKTIIASGTSALRFFTAVGAGKIAKFIRDGKKWRVNRMLVLFSMIYLIEEYESDDKRLNLSSDSQITALISNLFSKNISNMNGAVFQIVQTAYFHARHQTAPSVWPKVTGIDVVRSAHYLKNGLRVGNAYDRQIDIVLEYPDENKTEEWVEIKSYSGSTMSSSITKSGKKSKVFGKANIYREFFHDFRLNDEFITTTPSDKDEILNVEQRVAKTNQIFTWYFQDFTTPKGAGNAGVAPTKTRLNTLKKKLCRKPTDVREKDYRYNFKYATSKAVQNNCTNKVATQVELRNTKSYFTEVLDFVGSDFALTIKDELAGIE
jgi:hypothetical protein